MKSWHGILALLVVVGCTGAAVAQQPAIGVFFDTGASETYKQFVGGPSVTYTAYVYAVNTEQPVGGVAFKLDMDPRLTVLNAVYPTGIQIGAVEDGVQIGFTECYPGFYGVPVLCATLTLHTEEALVRDGELTISAYPPAGEIQISDCDGALSTLQGMTSTITIVPPAAIGVFFDTEATENYGVFNGGMSVFHTAYVFAVDTEQTVGGVAFKLNLDPAIELLNATFPAGIQVGSLTGGIQIGFTECYIGYYGVPVLCSTMTLWTGDNLLNDAELSISAYPMAGAVQLSDCDGALRAIDGRSAYMTIPVGAEEESWGAIKNLYND